ncbi:hypothetical protein IAR50_007622 [Cryptococcus sp. DSM 104548]
MAFFSSLAHNWQHFANHSGIPLFFWRRPNWSVDQIPDQSGKVVLITGGNSGTGYATALTIQWRRQRHYRLGIWGVRLDKRTLEEEKKLGSIDILSLDLADLTRVQRAAEEYKLRVTRLDLLYLNVGGTPLYGFSFLNWSSADADFSPTMVLTHQGLFTHLLSPRLEPARVITISSLAHNFGPPGGIDYLSLVRHPDDVANRAGSPKRGKNEQEM